VLLTAAPCLPTTAPGHQTPATAASTIERVQPVTDLATRMQPAAPAWPHLQTFAGPADANDELAGTPTTAGTYTFTMRLTDYSGQQATQRFSLAIDP